MAKINYLISGISGTGKTTICKALIARGYNAIDADDMFINEASEEWNWSSVLREVLNDDSSDVIFICGHASNRSEFMNDFKIAFMLYVDDKNMTARLENRNNDPIRGEKLRQMIQYNHDELRVDYGNKIFIDANRPVGTIADDILDRIVEIQ